MIHARPRLRSARVRVRRHAARPGAAHQAERAHRRRRASCASRTCWEEDAGGSSASARGSARSSSSTLRAIRIVFRAPGRAGASSIRSSARRPKRVVSRRARAVTLSGSPPSEGALAAMLETTPHNANLRCLHAARVVDASSRRRGGAHGRLHRRRGRLGARGRGVPQVARAGALARHPRQPRPLSLPHRQQRPPAAHSRRAKLARWQEFAAGAGLELEPCGAWKRVFEDAGAVVVGLNSCSRRQRAFFRQNGAIGPAQLEWLRDSATTPRGSARATGSSSFTTTSCRSRTASASARRRRSACASTTPGPSPTPSPRWARRSSCTGTGTSASAVRPAGHDFELLAAPSLTLGCKSGDAPSFWRVELDERVHVTRVRIPVEAVEQENDPGTDPPPPE